MATAYLTFGKVGKRGTNGVIETFIAGTTRSETVSTSGTSAQGLLTANKDEYVRIQCATAVAAVAGANPTATLAAGLAVTGGIPEYMAVQSGDKVALIDI